MELYMEEKNVLAIQLDCLQMSSDYLTAEQRKAMLNNLEGNNFIFLDIGKYLIFQVLPFATEFII